MSADDQIRQLEAQLASIRERASLDIANLQSDVIAKNREIGKLKAELAGVLQEDSPEAADVRLLLTLWHREVKGGDKRVKADLSSTRAPKVRKAIKRRGLEICRRAVLGVVYDDWAMGRNPKTGGKTFNDIAEHILDTDGHIEKFAGLYDTVRALEDAQSGSSGEQDRKPQDGSGVDTRRGPASTAHPRAPGELEKASASNGSRGGPQVPPRTPASPRARRNPTPPINRVLDHLHTVGCEWRASTSDGDSWQAQCPNHEDSLPSLSIRRLPDGKVLLNCFAGCQTEDILSRLCLEWRDLWDGADWDPCRDSYRRPSLNGHLSDDAKWALQLIQTHLSSSAGHSSPVTR